MRNAIVLFVLSALADPAIGHADAIGGPPPCPAGARGVSSHAGEWCAPWPCASDAECDGAACRPWRVCTRAAMVPPGGRGGFDRAPTRMELVVGTCEPARACTGTEEPPPSVAGTFEPEPPTCTDATFCVPAPLPPLPPLPPPPRPTDSVGSTPTAVPSSPLSPPPSPPPPGSARGCACGVAPTRAALAPIALAIAVISILSRRRR